MDILLVHNHYQKPGGEDHVFASEAKLLSDHGHRVVRYEVRNATIASQSRVGIAARAIWNQGEYRRLREVIRKERPQMLHAHNTFPLISPALYYAARSQEVPVVQTLHNYRLSCPAATLFREGQVCKECVGRRLAWPAIKHACYQGSSAGSTAIAAMLALHRWVGTWSRLVDAYIVPSVFSRDLLLEAGLPAHKMFVKPNFTESAPLTWRPAKPAAVFAGRLTREKGIETILEAWTHVAGAGPLHIIGDGPLGGLVRDFAAKTPNVHFHGWLEHSRVLEIFQASTLLLVPSTWHEVFGLTVIEAYSCGLPVIASRIGGLTEIVSDGRTGLHFTSGDSLDLAAKVNWACAHPAEMERMGRNARIEYDRKYTGELAHSLLMKVYRMAFGGFSSSSLRSSGLTPNPGVQFAPAEEGLDSAAGAL
jgi:glycosyltransferase involved in cell wall biosynthesis